jgi:hypothetical protein
MNPMLDLADLFDKIADEMTREAAPVAAPAPSEPKVAAELPKAAQLNSLVKSATGQELPAEVARRISNDPELYNHVTKLAEYGARPTPLGDAVEPSRPAAPMSKQARLQTAWERWNESVLGYKE